MTLLLDGRPRGVTVRDAAIGKVRRVSGDERPVRDRFFSGTIQSLTGRLTAAARRIIDDEELARDAVQEALLSLWLQAELPPNPRAWLLRAVRNRCLHLARGRSRRLKHEATARRARLEASDREDPAARLEREEWGRIFADSLNRLADDQRTILVLHLIDELDYQSIAIVLDIPIGTVRSRLSRARRALHDVLTGILPEEVRACRRSLHVGPTL
jgi:RNA polymerase sigma-70 factor (ECF subfamily)